MEREQEMFLSDNIRKSENRLMKRACKYLENKYHFTKEQLKEFYHDVYENFNIY